MLVKFSVVIPTYNRISCIKNAIDSLLAQTYQNFELIIVDDGSTDGTENYVKELYKKEFLFEKIRYVRQEKNNGLNLARNLGLKNAKNQWIVFLDTDNVMHANYLEVFQKSILKTPQNKIYYAKVKTMKTSTELGCEFDMDYLRISNFIDMGVFVFNIDICKEIGLFDEGLKRLTDWDFILRVSIKHKPIFINEVLLDYYDGDDLSRISQKEDFYLNYKKVIIKYLTYLPPYDFYTEYTKFYFEKIKKEKEIESLSKKNQAIETEVSELKEILFFKNEKINNIEKSNSWKITKPIRQIKDQILKIIRHT